MHHCLKQSNKKGFHKEYSSCGWSSENPVRGVGKCNRWNMDQWKSVGKVSMSKMLCWKFDIFAVTCSTRSLYFSVPTHFYICNFHPTTPLLFSVVMIFCAISRKLSKQLNISIEIVLNQNILEGWLVVVWEGDSWDPSQQFWGVEKSKKMKCWEV